ncbi:MAG: PilZ domain-containing protein [Pseudomonadota bacterium]
MSSPFFRDARVDEAGGALAAGAAGGPRAERLAPLSAVSLSFPLPSADGLWRYLPFLALAFCLFFAIRIEDRRGHARYRCSFPLDLPGLGPGRMVDVSRAGAKIAAETTPKVGARLKVDVLGEQVRGAVVWSNRRFFGLRFERLIPEETVSRLRIPKAAAGEPSPAPQPRPQPAADPAPSGPAATPGPNGPRWWTP